MAVARSVCVRPTVRVAPRALRFLLLPPLALLLVACEGRPTGTRESPAVALADSTVGAWIEAAGGMRAWRSIDRARYTVTTVWYDTTGRVRRMRPRRVTLRKTPRGQEARIERPEAEGLYVQTFNGDTAWAALNGTPLPPDDPAEREVRYVAGDVFYWFGLPFKLRDPGVHLKGRRLPGGGVEVEVTFGAGIGQHPGDRYYYEFLDSDPFPEEVDYVEQGSDTRDRTLWLYFHKAGPITYVGTRRYVDARGRITKELRIHDVVLEPTLADSLFAPPRGPDRPGR